MSIGPLGSLGASAAGSPLAQSKGSDVERAQDDTSAQKRRSVSDQKAENASGIGEADGEDHEAADRDADGRRLWEDTAQSAHSDGAHAEGSPSDRQSKDLSGQCGNLLDLSG